MIFPYLLYFAAHLVFILMQITVLWYPSCVYIWTQSSFIADSQNLYLASLSCPNQKLWFLEFSFTLHLRVIMSLYSMTYHIWNSNEPEFAAGCVGQWRGAVTAAIRIDSCVKTPGLSTTEIEMPTCFECQQEPATKHYINS